MIVEKLTDKELNEVKDSAMLLNGWSPELTWAVENNDLANDNLKYVRLEWPDGWELFSNLSEHMHKKLLTELVYLQIDRGNAGYESNTMKFLPSLKFQERQIQQYLITKQPGYEAEFRNIAYDSFDMGGR